MERIEVMRVPTMEEISRLSRKEEYMLWKEFVKSRLDLIARMQERIRNQTPVDSEIE